MTTYVAFYMGKKVKVEAETSYEAQQQAAKLLNIKESKRYMITVIPTTNPLDTSSL